MLSADLGVCEAEFVSALTGPILSGDGVRGRMYLSIRLQVRNVFGREREGATHHQIGSHGSGSASSARDRSARSGSQAGGWARSFALPPQR